MRAAVRIRCFFLLLAGCSSQPANIVPTSPVTADFPSTFSIVALDSETGDLGVAVQSKFFGVGAVVPWAEAGVGAIATQSYANTTYGPRGLALLREGRGPEEVLKKLTEGDSEREYRQVGIVDARGRSASFTGRQCLAWAGSRSTEGYSVQGNFLVSQATVEVMARAFMESKGSLAERLVLALEEGQKVGGDARGRQSAALLVVRRKAGYGGFNDRYVDLRVDDDPAPITELKRLVALHHGKDPVSLARRLDHQGQADEALRVLREAIDRTPEADAPRFELARRLLAAGKTDTGRRELAQVIALEPQFDHFHFRSAQILAEAGLESDCLNEVKKTLLLNPEYAHLFRRELESAVSPFKPLKTQIESLLRS